jgi:hypothetical protein
MLQDLVEVLGVISFLTKPLNNFGTSFSQLALKESIGCLVWYWRKRPL